MSTSFFWIRVMSFPSKFWTTMMDSSSNQTSSLSKGISERYLTSPFRAAYTRRISVLFPIPLGEWRNVSGQHMSRW